MKCLYNTSTDGTNTTATQNIHNVNGIVQHSSASTRHKTVTSEKINLAPRQGLLQLGSHWHETVSMWLIEAYYQIGWSHMRVHESHLTFTMTVIMSAPKTLQWVSLYYCYCYYSGPIQNCNGRTMYTWDVYKLKTTMARLNTNMDCSL